MDSSRPQAEPARQPAAFATTRWSVVLAAGDRASPAADEALKTLCETYWYPLYAYVRRRGSSGDDAADLTQEFFARLLDKPFLHAADPQRGRFRSFLLTVFKRFLSHERDRQQAQKRGGGERPLSIDMMAGEERYRLEPAENWTADKLFERRWALTLLDRVMRQLAEEYASRGKSALFEQGKAYLAGQQAAPSYATVAAELHMSETALRVAVHRMRQRYRELLTAAVAQTVEHGGDVAEEIQYLRAAIRGETG